MLSTTEYQKIKNKSVQGRYVVTEQIDSVLKKLPEEFKTEEIGFSVEKRSIKSVTIGKGTNRILMWSQMHGNESTTTKAVLDLFQYLQKDTLEVQSLIENCTIKIIPMLNPDGAFAYTRVNANNVDLNRDAQELTQPESLILKNAYNNFKPDFCFNLHDQRTIFNVSNTNKPATVSFLAPSHDAERSVSDTRGVSMQLIVAMNEELQKRIPDQIGRYDDGFNANCVGDAFQMQHTPTVLFEAGHYPEDYDREKTREYIFVALIKVLSVISTNTITDYQQTDYVTIPENAKQFFDILVANAEVLQPTLKQNTDVGVLFKETLVGSELQFIPQVDKIGDLKSNFYGHQTYDCRKKEELINLKKIAFMEDMLKNI